MSELARDLPVSPAVEQAVELARHGVVTHLTIKGERVAAIVPESTLDVIRRAEIVLHDPERAMENLRVIEDGEDAAEADTAMDEPGESILWEQVKAELGL